MNIYQKLQEARVKLQGMNLKKTGKNAFAKYSYYELGDFLPTINTMFAELKLFSMVTFSSEVARLDIINTEKPDETVVFISPMAEANLKGCHPIQNMGAVQTYQRRYLYMAALEIVEHDALDATTDPNKPQDKPASKPASTMAKITAIAAKRKLGSPALLKIASEAIGREISSSKDMTEAELKKLLDKLNE